MEQTLVSLVSFVLKEQSVLFSLFVHYFGGEVCLSGWLLLFVSVVMSNGGVTDDSALY